ncbi:alpha/beta fold hydrolase [Polymorphobacter sp.]|uniref:alpha/beta fold hydrolase n=1 Tax=Polymorphobacter sp. TaxID=1909290 RepID=UPI003F71302A
MTSAQAFHIPSADGEAMLHARLDGPRSAPVLTLLHTLATSTALYNPNIPALAADYRVLRLDMRGHGRSTAGTRPRWTIASLAADVLHAWDHLGIDASHLLGLSIGGMIGLEAALAHPARVLSLVAGDCRADAPPPFLALWPARRDLLETGGLAAVADATLPTWLTPAAAAEAVAEARAMILATSPAGYVAATHALETVDILPRLPGLAVPTLYLAGREDGAFPAALAAMQQATPGSRLHLIDATAHLPNLEAPEAFAAAVLPFLAQHTRAPA